MNRALVNKLPMNSRQMSRHPMSNNPINETMAATTTTPSKRCHLFYWHAHFNHGAICRGHYWAQSRAQVKQHLLAQSLAPKTIHREPPWRARINPAALHRATRHLATLLQAGLPLSQALEISIQRQTQPPLRQLLSQVLSEVQRGHPLSQALAPFSQYFDSLYQALIRSGEAAGQLPLMLTRVAQHQAKQQQLRQQLQQALLYPICIITVGTLVMLGLLLGLMPRFEQLFIQLDAPLPPLTEALFQSAHWIRDWGGYWLCIVVSGLYMSRHQPWPIIHPLRQQAAWVRFAHTLATLLDSGLPLLNALDNAIHTATPAVWRTRWPLMAQSLQAGQSLHHSLTEAHLLPALMLDMIQMGEQAGTLPEMLKRAADDYEEALNHRVQQWLTLLEPITLVLLATLVGIMILAIYMPLFQLGTLF